jgi:hypothetical protein
MKISVALKLDFKIDEKEIVRIFDIGDGLAADIMGFEDIPLDATILRDLCSANKSSVTTVFGELPLEIMQPQTMHLPIIQRKIPAQCSWIDISDLSKSDYKSLLPYSYAGRIQSYISHFWGKKLASVEITPIGLMGMEMHKLLWYVLMQKHLSSAYKDNILYWSNDNPVVELDLSAINTTHGVFIKIGDHSIGGGNDVYYAKDASDVTKTLSKLHQTYQSCDQSYKKHIFVIEPAYQTIKSYDNEDYNVTGRAFVTLTLDTETHEMQIKIAGAKWMFPIKPLRKVKTQEQMFSNLEHSIGILPLSSDELDILSQQIVKVYGDIFAASIEHEDLIEYCKDHSIIEVFRTILRPNACYKMMIGCSKLEGSDEQAQQEQILMKMINTFVFTHYLPQNLPALLGLDDKMSSFFSTETPTKEFLIKKICTLSFLESYVKFIKTCSEPFITFPKVITILNNESLISLKLDALIKQFLSIKDKTYDLKDMNRALRQAASVSDIEILKLLIGTHRASVSERSPKSQQTALDFALKSNGEMSLKENCIQLLKQNGAESGQPQTLFLGNKNSPSESKKY